jgi:hypothetical protein
MAIIATPDPLTSRISVSQLTFIANSDLGCSNPRTRDACVSSGSRAQSATLDRYPCQSFITATTRLWYKSDIVVQQELILEIKSVERFLPIHEAQLLTYLRISGRKIGLLMNFNTLVLKDGIRRFVI